MRGTTGARDGWARRFGDRVADYIRARPGYPDEALDWMDAWDLFRPNAHIADVGAGTGIFTRRLLERGVQVTAVEPNAPMRAAIGDYPTLAVLDGTSESTGLPDNSVSAITAAQAFHWFDLEPTSAEFERILRPGGEVCLLWNARDVDPAFNVDYDAFLKRWGTDYEDVRFRNGAAELRNFFTSSIRAEFPNEQRLDAEGLRARICSCSYIPGIEHADHWPMLDALPALFEPHAVNGKVLLSYTTTVILGSL